MTKEEKKRLSHAEDRITLLENQNQQLMDRLSSLETNFVNLTRVFKGILEVAQTEEGKSDILLRDKRIITSS